MNANAFRYLFDYHFTENRRVWDDCVTPLSPSSSRKMWLTLMGLFETRSSICWKSMNYGSANWAVSSHPKRCLPPAVTIGKTFAKMGLVEQSMRDYLAQLQDDMLFDKPIKEPEEDKDLIVWQVLLHVVNHGTDHRAQLLRLIHDFGVKTTSQDFIFYIYDHPQP